MSMFAKKCLFFLSTVHFFDSIQEQKISTRTEGKNPSSRLQHVASQTHRVSVELSAAHLLSLSCAIEPALQAVSLCLFLSNSHSLFTFAFLHCDSRQNNVNPGPRGTDCQASLFKAVLRQRSPCS